MTIQSLDETIRSSPAEGAEIDELWAAGYDELKKLARSRLRRSGPYTVLDTTALVNETYLRLAAFHRLPVQHRGQFFAYSARAMRSVVLDLVRDARAAKRGGDAQKVTLNTSVADGLAASEDPLQIDEALNELASVEPRLAQVIEMRYFGGYTEAQIGESLGLAERTVRRDWERGRVLLRAMLSS